MGASCDEGVVRDLVCARVRVPTIRAKPTDLVYAASMDLDTLRHRLGGRGASLPNKVIAFKGEPAFPEPSIKMACLDARAQHLINP